VLRELQDRERKALEDGAGVSGPPTALAEDPDQVLAGEDAACGEADLLPLPHLKETWKT